MLTLLQQARLLAQVGSQVTGHLLVWWPLHGSVLGHCIHRGLLGGGVAPAPLLALSVLGLLAILLAAAALAGRADGHLAGQCGDHIIPVPDVSLELLRLVQDVKSPCMGLPLGLVPPNRPLLVHGPQVVLVQNNGSIPPSSVM